MDKPVILHVEDQDEVAFIVKEAFSETLHPGSLFRVSGGEEALAFLNQEEPFQEAAKPKLVLLDLNMPKVDGWAVLSAAQEKEQLSDIPIIVLSTSTRDSDRVRALSLGARGYVVKPATFSGLVDALNNTLAQFVPAEVDSSLPELKASLASHR